MAFFRLGIQDALTTLDVGLQSVPLGFIFGIPSTGVFLGSITVVVFAEAIGKKKSLLAF